MTAIEHLLRQTIGLDAASLGPAGIHRAVRLRMQTLGLKRPEDYQRFLRRSRAEWNELVESVVVTETWFFRDPEAIGAFVRLVLDVWLPTHPFGPLRLLSLPCEAGACLTDPARVMLPASNIFPRTDKSSTFDRAMFKILI